MGRVLHVLIVAAHLAAASFVCPATEATAPSPELLRAYAADALHAHGAASKTGAGELHAPCPCGCDEAPAPVSGFAPLGAALLPAAPRAELPRAVHRDVSCATLRGAPTPPPDPVPKLA